MKTKINWILVVILAVVVFLLVNKYMDNRIKLAREESNRVEQRMAEKNKRLQDQIGEFELSIDTLLQDIGDRDSYIDSLESEIDKKEDVIDSIEDDLRDLNREQVITLANLEYVRQTQSNDTTADLSTPTVRFLLSKTLENEQRKEMIRLMQEQEIGFRERIRASDGVILAQRNIISNQNAIQKNTEKVVTALKKENKKLERATKLARWTAGIGVALALVLSAIQ